MAEIPTLDRGRIHIYSDFDGTITTKDTLMFLATTLGGGEKMVETIGRLIREGDLTLRDAIAAEMRSIRAPFADAEDLLRKNVTLDPGFRLFVEFCEDAGSADNIERGLRAANRSFSSVDRVSTSENTR